MRLDRIKSPIQRLIDGNLPQLDYLATYPGQVLHQRDSNAFDFQPDDPGVPVCSGIPLKLPFPGFSLTLDTSAMPRAELCFAEGSPSAPYLGLWEEPGIQSITIQAASVSINGGPAAAREGDSVRVTLQPTDIAQITAPPSGGPCSGGPIDVNGTITSGSSTTTIG